MLERLGITSRRELAVLVSLILLVAVTPAGNEATHPVVLALYRTLLFVIIAAYATWAGRTQLRRLCSYFLLAGFAVAALMTISVLRWEGSLFEGFYVLYETLLFLAAFIALAHAGSGRPVAWKRTILGAVVLIDLAYIAGAMAIGSRPLQGPFVNPNYLASFVLPGLAVCAAAVFRGSSLPWRIVAAASGFFLYFGILQTSSRGATLAGLVLLGLGGFRAARRSGLSWLRIGLAGGLLLAVTLAANPVLIQKFLDRGERDPYNYQRGQIWLATLSMIGEYPVTGVGLSHYYYVAKLFTPAVEGTIARYGKWPNIAHSEYLQYVAEIGIPGGLLLFATGGYLFLLAWRRAHTLDGESGLIQEAAILAAAGLGIHALVDNNWTVPVLSAGLAVIAQADLLPYRNGARLRLQSLLWRPAATVIFAALWVDAVVISSIGLYFNEAGHQAHVAGNFESAEWNHRFALGFLPEHPVLLDNLGLVYLKEYMKTKKPDHLDRAENLFSEAMLQNPRFDTPPGHLESTLIQRLTGDPTRDMPLHKRIIEADKRLLAVNPFNPFTRKNLAEGLYNIGDRKQASEELLKAIEIEPNYVPAYLRLSELYREEGRIDESDAFKKQAIQIVVTHKDTPTQDPFEGLLLGRPLPREQP